MEIFDSHTHINSRFFATDADDAVKRAQAFGVTAMLLVAYDDYSAQKMLELCERYPNIYGAVGIHPDDALNYDDTKETWLEEVLAHPKVRVLGEIGLDYHNDVDHQVQKEVFKRQLELAFKHNLPVTIHNRDAISDTYDILQASEIYRFGGIMHSFNGDKNWATKFLDLGMYLSYSGVVTFGNAKEVKEAALATPLDKMLVETDAPYLTPLPFRGRANEPALTRYTVEFLATNLQMQPDKLAKITYQNTERLLRINDTRKNEN